MQWVLKATKFCNLRCKYCYEWDHLSDPTRMTLETWKNALIAIRDYSLMTESMNGEIIPTDIIWHGGEPLVLPLSYFEEVLQLQREIFSDSWFQTARITNCIQTNLYSISDNQIDFLRDNAFNVGVSIDFFEGVRVSAGGQETQVKVKNNLARLQEKNLPFDIITVIARHTISDPARLFKEFSQFDSYVRLLPLFSGPAARPMANAEASKEEILTALVELFEHWFDANMKPDIDPFDEALRVIVMKRMNLSTPKKDRGKFGSEVLVVDRDGSLSCVTTRDDRVIGNLNEQKISEIVRTNSYLKLALDENFLKSKVCETCSYSSTCSTEPISRNFDSNVLADCPTEKYLYPLIEEFLEERNFFDEEFISVANQMQNDYFRKVFSGPQ